MYRYKKKIIILLCSLVIYFVLIYIKGKITNQNLTQVYILNKDVQRGEKIEHKDVTKINIDTTTLNFKFVESVENIVANEELKCGQILNKYNVLNESEYVKVSSEDKERIAIKLSDLNTNASSIFDKGSIVNIYYTGRSSQLEDIILSLNAQSIKSSSISDSYTTIALIENVKIINLYDKNGKKINNDNTQINIIDSIEIEVEKNMAAIIENLKNYGKFSVTVKR